LKILAQPYTDASISYDITIAIKVDLTGGGADLGSAKLEWPPVSVASQIYARARYWHTDVTA
jgi:hypothetical protein